MYEAGDTSGRDLLREFWPSRGNFPNAIQHNPDCLGKFLAKFLGVSSQTRTVMTHGPLRRDDYRGAPRITWFVLSTAMCAFFD
jgi:hypothetical protein